MGAGKAQVTPTRVIRWGTGATITIRGALFRAASSPHGELLMRVFAQPRRPASWQAKLRQYKADIARAAGWVPSTASDAQALQHFKGRGDRADLVRAVPVRGLDPQWAIAWLLKGCGEWLDYLRTQGVTSAEDLAEDLLQYGIVQCSPSLANVVALVGPRLRLSEARYRRGRSKLGREVLANLWSPGCPDPDDFVKKLRRRHRGRWPNRTIKLSRHAAEMLVAADERSHPQPTAVIAGRHGAGGLAAQSR